MGFSTVTKPLRVVQYRFIFREGKLCRQLCQSFNDKAKVYKTASAGDRLISQCGLDRGTEIPICYRSTVLRANGKHFFEILISFNSDPPPPPHPRLENIITLVFLALISKPQTSQCILSISNALCKSSGHSDNTTVSSAYKNKNK